MKSAWIDKNRDKKATAILKIDLYLKKCARDIEKCTSNLDYKKVSPRSFERVPHHLHFENINDISKSQLDQNRSLKILKTPYLITAPL